MNLNDLNIGQPVLVLKDKRDSLDIKVDKDRRRTLGFAHYEGYFPWAVMFHDEKGWQPGIFMYEDYISGELCTLEDVPMRDLFHTAIENGNQRYALPVYRHRFIVGKYNVRRTRLWEHEIDFQIINIAE